MCVSFCELAARNGMRYTVECGFNSRHALFGYCAHVSLAAHLSRAAMVDAENKTIFPSVKNTSNENNDESAQNGPQVPALSWSSDAARGQQSISHCYHSESSVEVAQWYRMHQLAQLGLQHDVAPSDARSAVQLQLRLASQTNPMAWHDFGIAKSMRLKTNNNKHLLR